MDSEPAELTEVPVPADSGAETDEARRVEELLRVNARLAAEVRSLTLARAEAPRPGAMTAARRLAVLAEERDTLAMHLGGARNEVDAARAELELARTHCGQLERANTELAREVARLRGGPRGMMRRGFARLLRL